MKFSEQINYEGQSFRALKGLICVKMDDSLKFLGNIALPAHAREEVQTGTVVTAGPGMHDEKGVFKENPVKDGDRVLISKSSGMSITVLGEELLFLSPDEITGIIHEE